ncbi:MAG: glycosyltransferase family 9 protein [Pirellulales bacterium]
MSVTLSEIVPDRILLIRLGAVRDGLMTVPLAVDTKKIWPNSKLSWIVDGEMEHILQEHPRVDEVIRIEPNWLRRPRSWRSLKKLLTSKRFDLILDPQGVCKSAMLGWISGCQNRLGFDHPYSRELAAWLFTKKIRPTARHRVDVYRQLLSPWTDVQSGEGQFEVPSDPIAAAKVRHLVDRLFGVNQPWFAIYPGAIWNTATWPIDRFALVAQQMRKSFDLPGLVVWSGQHEQLVASVIAEQSEGASKVAPKLNLKELVELCRQATFVLAGDSDLLQIASSVGTNCISLHGPTWADEYGPYKLNEFAIQSPAPRLTNRSMRSGSNISMQAIESDEVIYYINRLLRFMSLQEKNWNIEVA